MSMERPALLCGLLAHKDIKLIKNDSSEQYCYTTSYQAEQLIEESNR